MISARPDEQAAAWVEALGRLAREVGSLPPAACDAIRAVLDAVVADDGIEVLEARPLRSQLDALDRANARQRSALAAA